ncbi:biopolymer transport protein TolQ [Sphingorhabdus rigui]|uniref:Biopolymer transport protein TolQ n=2 Tax=Sphingorhabdus TaxID=1434046 RepID=A0A840AUX1_9SPHN|nr:protein TolQ [Sphingorhabdus rigui]MBB3941948.1 biopolymer transport protein TolQ [Sphingorhabdus rigui]
MDLLIATQNVGFSPIKLFLDADLVVKAVIIGLALSSIWAWTIIVSFTIKMSGIRRQSEKFETEFWESNDIAAFAKTHGQSTLPVAKVFAAGMTEWRRSTNGKTIDRAGTRERLSTAMDAMIAAETDRLANRLNFLATTGSVAPFVGLFGTVWGIMRSFAAIAAEQNSSLAVVAPGIAEALFATAIGLFAAIPAVIAYNRFSHRLNQYEARMGRFADGFHGTLSRELEHEV